MKTYLLKQNDFCPDDLRENLKLQCQGRWAEKSLWEKLANGGGYAHNEHCIALVSLSTKHALLPSVHRTRQSNGIPKPQLFYGYELGEYH